MRGITLVALAMLAGCTTTENTESAKNVDIRNLYLLGYYVKYSELYSQFSGSGAPLLLTRSLKKKHEDDKNFSKGYAINSGLEGFDKITNLNKCGLAKDVVIRAANGAQKATS